jgi:hypothetical protein
MRKLILPFLVVVVLAAPLALAQDAEETPKPVARSIPPRRSSSTRPWSSPTRPSGPASRR